MEQDDNHRIGQTIVGKYRLDRRLGAGSMGDVYEGVHVEIGKRVAIKMIRPTYASSRDAVARFRREARAASAVESDYIVQIFDVGEDDAHGLFMILEYLVGRDLDGVLSTE